MWKEGAWMRQLSSKETKEKHKTSDQRNQIRKEDAKQNEIPTAKPRHEKTTPHGEATFHAKQKFTPTKKLRLAHPQHPHSEETTKAKSPE